MALKWVAQAVVSEQTQVQNGRRSRSGVEIETVFKKYAGETTSVVLEDIYLFEPCLQSITEEFQFFLNLLWESVTWP